MVSHRQSGYTFAKLNNDPGTFVTHDHRERGIPLAALHVEVGVTNACRCDFYAHLAGFWRGEIHITEFHR